MKTQSGTHILSFLRSYVNTASLLSMGVGLVVLVGWFLDIPIFKSFLPGMPAMRFNTAITFVLVGGALWLIKDEAAGLIRKRLGKALVVFVLLLCLVSLGEYIFGWNLGIDELIFRDLESAPEQFPGRVSPFVIVSVGFISIGLLTLGSRLSQYLALVVGAFSLVAIMNNLFSFQRLYLQPQSLSVAVPATIVLLFVSLALLAARPTRGLMKVLSSDLPGSKAMRRLLPVMIILTIVMGRLVEMAGDSGLVNASQKSLLLVVALILVYSPLIYFFAGSINTAEERVLYSNRLYATLSQVNQTIVRVKGQQELFEAICKVAVDFGEFRLAWIGLLNAETGQVSPVAEYGYGSNKLPFQTIDPRDTPFEYGLIGLSLRTEAVTFSNDIQTDPTMKHWRETAVRDGYHSAAAVPIRQKGKPFGLLNLYAADIGFFITPEERSLLEEIGLDISFALDMIQTEAERQRAEEKLHRQNQRLKALREIDTAILAADSLENIVEAALDHIRELIGCERANLVLIDWEKNEAVNFDVRDTKESAISRGARVSLDLIQDILHILSQNQPVLMKDLTLLPDPPSQVKILIKEGLRSRCILPLSSHGKLIGSFTLSSTISDYFDEEKINLGREVANQVAIAISQHNLIEDLRILNAGLEQRITERTADLSRTNSELEHANRTKNDFLATMSHELRTPLNSILGLSESLLEQKRGTLNDHQQKSLQTIEASGQHLLNVINDILEVSKIEAGKLSIYPDKISVKEVCESSLNFVRELALKKSISLEFQSDPSVHTVYADPQRLKQILVNLLNNAVKFTPENETVSLEVHPNAERDQIIFSVTDKGIGIAPNDLKKLFTPFTQLDSSLAREYPGTGLGLVLVYKMTELHGGSVQVESEVGRGSRFTIVLPWNEGEITRQFTSKKLSTPIEVLQKPTLTTEAQSVILLADDNESNILVVDDYLQDRGYKVIVAHNGLEALKKAEVNSPDMILMDVQMPEMDGLEAIRQLRLNPRFSSTPIIALTALAMPGDRERCLEAGANEYMSKPVSLKSLAEKIQEILSKNNKLST